MKKLITLFAVVLLVACGSKEGKEQSDNNDYMKPTSTGRINHVIVVVEDDVWKGEAGQALRDIIQEPLVGLPQTEFKFNISTIPPRVFTKMFKTSKNLLFLQLEDKNVFHLTSNEYAIPQTILQVKAPTVEQLTALVKLKANEIVNTFRNGDLLSIQKDNEKNKYKQKINTLTELGIDMVIPNKYRMVMDTLGSFMWMRSYIAGGIAKGDQTNNIIVYTAPLFNDDQPLLEQIIKNRDSIGKAYVRGHNPETMYMITEAARVPVVKTTTINGKKAYETRGTWEVFGAFNAGPFLNYSIVDEENNRLIVIEGFNYAPSVNKRDFVFELEAILKTVKF